MSFISACPSTIPHPPCPDGPTRLRDTELEAACVASKPYRMSDDNRRDYSLLQICQKENVGGSNGRMEPQHPRQWHCCLLSPSKSLPTRVLGAFEVRGAMHQRAVISSCMHGQDILQAPITGYTDRQTDAFEIRLCLISEPGVWHVSQSALCRGAQTKSPLRKAPSQHED